MKYAIAMLVTMLGAATTAQADGFECRTEDGKLKVKAYNHVMPEDGTRVGSVMVLSNPQIRRGRQTIARFTDVKGTLTSTGATYVANVDLRYGDSNRAGEYIGGTRLGELDRITLDVNFTYAEPIEDGAEVEGVLELLKRNGDQIVLDLACVRYIKD